MKGGNYFTEFVFETAMVHSEIVEDLSFLFLSNLPLSASATACIRVYTPAVASILRLSSQTVC